MEGRLLIYYSILVGVAVISYVTASDSRSLTQEQVIAQCHQIASTQSQTLAVPFAAGAVDSRAWPNYHPCKNSYFETSCRAQVHREAFSNCVKTLSRR